jgi:hypothetical protein
MVIQKGLRSPITLAHSSKLRLVIKRFSSGRRIIRVWRVRRSGKCFNAVARQRRRRYRSKYRHDRGACTDKQRIGRNGMLTAAIYSLTGGTVNPNLGTGTFTQISGLRPSTVHRRHRPPTLRVVRFSFEDRIASLVCRAERCRYWPAAKQPTMLSSATPSSARR